MGIDLAAPMTITAPSASDGRGQVAVLNNSASSDFVGYLFEVDNQVKESSITRLLFRYA